ncbi:MAG: hypothetical protein Q7S96_00580 [bacterium]|nr:hypothetical protein [bacterium]
MRDTQMPDDAERGDVLGRGRDRRRTDDCDCDSDRGTDALGWPTSSRGVTDGPDGERFDEVF